MDDQHSSTPMSDFLQNLSQKAATTVAEKAPEASDDASASDDAVKPAEPVATIDAETPKADDQKAIAANKARIIVKALKAMEQNIANIVRLLEEDAPGAADAATNAAEPVDLSM